MKLKSTLIVILLCCIGFIAWFVSSTPDPATEQRKVVEAPASTPRLASAPSEASATNETTSNETPQAQSHRMLDEFNRAPNYRAFIYNAKKDPSQGGLFYVSNILIKCQFFASPYVRGQDSPEKEAARERLTKRCDMTKEEMSKESADEFNSAGSLMINRLRAMAAKNPSLKEADIDQRALIDQGDPLQTISQRLTHPNATREEKAAAMIDAMKSNEPFLFLGLLQNESVNDASGNSVFAVYFNDVWYQTQAQSTMFLLAHNLSLCEFGLDCGANSTSTLSLCANRGFCGDSVANAKKNGLASQNQNQTQIRFEDVQQLAASIRTEINRRNADAFLPKKSKGH